MDGLVFLLVVVSRSKMVFEMICRGLRSSTRLIDTAFLKNKKLPGATSNSI